MSDKEKKFLIIYLVLDLVLGSISAGVDVLSNQTTNISYPLPTMHYEHNLLRHHKGNILLEQGLSL